VGEESGDDNMRANCKNTQGSPVQSIGEYRVPTNQKLTCEMFETLHDAYDLSWPDLHMGAKEGSVVFRSQGCFYNNFLLEQMQDGDRPCEDVIDNDEFCYDFTDFLEKISCDDPIVAPWLLTIGGSIAGLFGVFLVFGPGVRKYNKWADRKEVEKAKKEAAEKAAKAPTNAVAGLVSASIAAASAAAIRSAKAAAPAIVSRVGISATAGGVVASRVLLGIGAAALALPEVNDDLQILGYDMNCNWFNIDSSECKTWRELSERKDRYVEGGGLL